MHRRRLLLLLGSSLLVPSLVVGLVGCSRSASSKPAGHSSEDLRKLTVKQVADRINSHDSKLAIFDCNSKEQFNGAHLPGAKWVNFHELKPADLPPDKTTTLVFYCLQEA
jgi:hypothetical protein